jgi:mannose-6-phosphate isomerase-like protein (cupin superfamily)
VDFVGHKTLESSDWRLAMSVESGPAPRLGQKWNLFEFEKKGIEFTTMIGTFVLKDQGQQPPVPPPALADLSLHYWHLKHNKDDQTPHKQDEAYFVLQGRGKLTIEGQVYSLEPGDLIFVPRCVEHHFSDFEAQGQSLLVIFGPNFTG